MSALDALLSRHTGKAFASDLLDRVMQTGHGKIHAEHVLAAWILREDEPVALSLRRAQHDPVGLAEIVVRFLPDVDAPAMPPMSFEEDTIEDGLRAACSAAGASEVCSILASCLSDPVRDLLDYSGALAAVREADRVLPEVVVRLFDASGALNDSVLSSDALALMDRVAATAAKVGHDQISLPLVFLGAAQDGILAEYLATFVAGSAAVLEQLEAQLAKGQSLAVVPFSRDRCSLSASNWVEQVEQAVRDENADRIDEVVLVSTICRLESDLLGSYWALLGVTPRDVLNIVSMRRDESPTGSEVVEEPATDAVELLEKLQGRVIGQESAIGQMLDIIRRWMSGWREPGSTAGTVLFLGPPGVGKTELSKELAELLYGDRSMLCFIEMNQFKHDWGISSLIGSPPGYKGRDSGKLTDWIRDQPESIILFDEVEKADPGVFDILLRLLNEGVISDAKGEEYDASGILILMTSNIGQKEGVFDRAWERRKANVASLDAGQEEEENPLADEEVKNLLLNTFRPEFLDRIKKVVLFNPLGLEELGRIARIQLERLEVTFQEQFGVDLILEGDVAGYVADVVTADGRGARAVKTTIEKYVLDPALAARQRSPGDVVLRMPSGDEAGP